MMMARVAAAWLASVTLWACGNHIDRPPPPAGCTNACTGPRTTAPTGGSTTSVGGGDAGGTDADSGGILDGPATVTISGTVYVLQNETLSTSSQFVGRAEVAMEGANGRVVTQIDGPSYSLENANVGRDVWADLQPLSTVLDVPATIENVSTDVLDRTVPLYFARTAVMEAIAQNLELPVELDPTKAQAILFFVDDAGAGVSGYQVTAHPGEVAAYDVGGGLFQENASATAQNGEVIVLNAPAVQFPGSVVQISYTGATTGTKDIKIAQGAVSLVTIDVTR